MVSERKKIENRLDIMCLYRDRHDRILSVGDQQARSSC